MIRYCGTSGYASTLSSDMYHASGRWAESRFANMMAILLLLDSFADEAGQVVIRAAVSQNSIKIVLPVGEQASANLSVRGEPDAAAGAAERLGDRSYNSDFSDPVVEGVTAGGLAGIGGRQSNDWPKCLELAEDLSQRHHRLPCPFAALAQGHEFDESYGHTLLAREVGEFDDLMIIESTYQNTIYFYRFQPRAFGGANARKHMIEAAGHASDARKDIRIDSIHAHRYAGQPRFFQGLSQTGKEMAVGGNGNVERLADSAKASPKLSQAHDHFRQKTLQQRLAAGDSHLFDSQSNEDPDHAQVVFHSKVRESYAAVSIPAVHAPVVAAIRDRDTQIGDRPAELVDQPLVTRDRGRNGEIVGGRNLRVRAHLVNALKLELSGVARRGQTILGQKLRMRWEMWDSGFSGNLTEDCRIEVLPPALKVEYSQLAMNTPAELKETTDQTAEFSSASGSLFHGYFNTAHHWKFRKNDLIDARGRRVFETTALACSAKAYPFQIPLEKKSGPEVQADGQDLLMLSSYDYLGLIGDPRVDAAAIEAVRKYGTGTGGARLLTGTTEEHLLMEQDLASFLETEAAVTVSSGYLANVAIIGGLFGSADRVIMDALCHRSLTDACRFAGVQLQRFRHNDLKSLRHELQNGPAANRTLIVTEGVFSMDGDTCNLPEIVAIKKEFRCFLLVDDSHAIGVLGKTGRGVREHFGVPASDVDLLTGSLAKAIPANGGFIACSQEMAIFLQHAASPYIFSASLSPSAVAAIREGLRILRTEPELVEKIRHNADYLRQGLQKLGYNTGLSETAVVPVILNDETTTGLFARRLRDYGILAAPVLFPAVPQDTARLRLCVTAAHTKRHLDFALGVFERLAKEGS